MWDHRGDAFRLSVLRGNNSEPVSHHLPDSIRFFLRNVGHVADCVTDVRYAPTFLNKEFVSNCAFESVIPVLVVLDDFQ